MNEWELYGAGVLLVLFAMYTVGLAMRLSLRQAVKDYLYGPKKKGK